MKVCVCFRRAAERKRPIAQLSFLSSALHPSSVFADVSFASHVTTTRFSPLAPPAVLSEDRPAARGACVSVEGLKTTGTCVNPCAFV